MIEVITKSELTTSMRPIKKEDGSFDYENKNQYGIYERKYPMRFGIMRTKDMTKFSKFLRKMFEEKKVKSRRTGMNAGTPVAMSWEVRWKEIFVGELNE